MIVRRGGSGSPYRAFCDGCGKTLVGYEDDCVCTLGVEVALAKAGCVLCPTCQQTRKEGEDHAPEL